MKLAEALTLRADIQKRVMQIKSRLNVNAKVQEGEKPAESPDTLLKELDALLAEMEELMVRINLTNAQTLTEGETITSLLAKRDCLTQKVGILREFLLNASSTVMRGTRTEVKVLSTVPVPELQKQVDKLSKELRETDTRIQALNWTTELL